MFHDATDEAIGEPQPSGGTAPAHATDALRLAVANINQAAVDAVIAR